MVSLLDCCINLDNSIADPENKLFKVYVANQTCLLLSVLEANLFPSGTAKDLFWRYLFPVVQHMYEPVPSVMLNRAGRERLYHIVFELVKGDDEQLRWLLEDLKKLVPFDKEDEGMFLLDSQSCRCANAPARPL